VTRFLDLGASFLRILAILFCLTISAEGQSRERCGPLIVDVLFGEPISMEMMIDDLFTARIVYLGEVHTIARHHSVQAEILEKLAQRGMKLALGMEMFGEHQQAILDQWQSGTESVADLIKNLGSGHWTNLLDYEALLLAAREREVPILCLNADDHLVRLVARKGLDALSAAEKERLPSGILPVDPQYERLLRLRLHVHKAFQGKSLDNIVIAQAVRDQTMARALLRFLTSDRGRDRSVVVVAGTGHINYGFGIPARVEKELDVPYRIVLPSESGELVLSEADKRQAIPVEVTHQDLKFIRQPIADYLHIVPRKSDENGAEPFPYRAGLP